MTALEHVVVVGASAAGISAADGLREGGFTGTITLLSAEDRLPYDRTTLSKAVLAEGPDAEPPLLRTPDQLAAKGYDLRLGVAATGLDAAGHLLTTTDGVLGYDALILACGTRVRTMSTDEGAVLPAVYTADDLAATRAALAGAADVAVVGSSFVGMEIASALRTLGHAVTVFGETALPLQDAVGPGIAAHLAALHAGHGVELMPSASVTGIGGRPGDYAVRYRPTVPDAAAASEHILHAAGVVTGIGAVPNTDWLAGTGLALDGGVVADAAGRTGVPGVWAAGDCATFYHPRYSRHVRIRHWNTAMAHGHHVGRNVAQDADAPYSGVPSLWTEQFGRTFHLHGLREPGDEEILMAGALDQPEFIVAFVGGGIFRGFGACGLMREQRALKKLLTASAPAEALLESRRA